MEIWHRKADSCGIQEFDEMLHGESVSSIGSLLVYEQTQKTVPLGECTPTTNWNAVSMELTPVVEGDPNIHRMSNMVLYYAALPCALDDAFQTISTRLQYHKVLL